MIRPLTPLLMTALLMSCEPPPGGTFEASLDASVALSSELEDSGEAEQDQSRVLRSGLLVNPFDWEALPQDTPPFERETPGACSEDAYGPEDLTGVWVYSIDTEFCDWLSVRQPIALPIEPGDTIRARVWHFELTAPLEATAQVAIALGEVVIAMEEKDIPSASAMLTLEAETTSAWPKGSPMTFHVHNHGANSWHLVEVQLNPEDRAPSSSDAPE